MKSLLSILLVCVFSLSHAQKSENQMVDLKKSQVVWVGKKVTGEHSGKINLSQADLIFENEILVGGSFTLAMNSITCTDLDEKSGNKLIGHLQSEDFFNTKEFETAVLTIVDVKQIEGSSYSIKADLTIKGITKTIEFNADLRKGSAMAVLKINRTLYDIKYGSASFFDTLGDRAIDDIFEVKVNLILN